MPLTKPEIEELLKKNPQYICDGEELSLCVQIVAVADFPTRFGNFQIVAFYNNEDDKDHVAIVKGDVMGRENVPLRIHSECLTGDALGSLRCDCRDQLTTALEKIGAFDNGILLYLRQEGRGIGLMNKMKAYQLQDFGYDTVEANEALGFRDDERDYHIAAHMLLTLEVRSVRLITNNPSKSEGLGQFGIDVTGRIPILIEPNPKNKEYLRTKMEKSRHMLDDLFDGE